MSKRKSEADLHVISYLNRLNATTQIARIYLSKKPGNPENREAVIWNFQKNY